MKRISVVTAGVLVFASAFSAALRGDEAVRRPKIGVAFAGGGARGGAHVGVLKVLEELHIPIDYVAGTSIGSIVAALYATGMSPDEMERVLSSTDWDDALQDDVARRDRPYRAKEDDSLYLIKPELGFSKRKLVLPAGLVAGQKLGYLIRRLTLPACETVDFDNLPVPFRAVATDIVTGDKVVLGKGDIARAVRASMAIPGFFSPVELDGKLLVDGGSADNLPIDVVRAMGADIVIAIDISTPLDPREKLTNFLSITNQTSGFLTRLNVLEQITTLTKKDLLITPNLEGISTLAFSDFPKAVNRGETAGRDAVEALRRFSVPEAEYAEFLKKQRVAHIDPRIDAVRVESVPGVDPRLLSDRVHTKPGPLDWPRLERDLARLYQLGTFETVDFRVVEEAGKSVLDFVGRPRPPAPDRLRLGLKLDTDFDADSSFGLRLGFYKTRLNALQGELRTKIEVGRINGLGVEFYQPVDFGGTLFLSPTISVARSPQDVFEEENTVARVIETKYTGRLDAGVSLGALGEVRAGVVREQHHIETDIFAGTPRSANERVAAVSVRANLDQLDSVSFPRNGWAASSDLLLAGKAVGGEWSYNRLLVKALLARTLGETSIVPSVSFDSRLGPDPRPDFDQALVGGFLSLSGLKPNQLRGQYGGVARIVAYHRLSEFNSLIGTGIYAGGSIETGNTWQDSISLSQLRLAGSLFVSADTIVGPLYFAYGIADGGHHAFYLSLGFPIN